MPHGADIVVVKFCISCLEQDVLSVASKNLLKRSMVLQKKYSSLGIYPFRFSISGNATYDSPTKPIFTLFRAIRYFRYPAERTLLFRRRLFATSACREHFRMRQPVHIPMTASQSISPRELFISLQQEEFNRGGCVLATQLRPKLIHFLAIACIFVGRATSS